MKLRRGLLALSLALPLAASAQELTVSAAASLREALGEIGPAFEARHPGVKLRYNFAASGVLLQQIAQGAPVDLFASADEETMDRAASQQLIAADSRRVFASNSLVLVAPTVSGLSALEGLNHPSVRRIAIGKPASVPVGRYTQQALEAAKLWIPLQAKLVPADNVRQVLDYVARGEVEAGFVYRSDALTAKDKVRIVMTVEGHPPVRYPAAVLKDSRQPQLARALLDELLAASAQAVLKKHGFGAP